MFHLAKSSDVAKSIRTNMSKSSNAKRQCHPALSQHRPRSFCWCCIEEGRGKLLPKLVFSSSSTADCPSSTFPSCQTLQNDESYKSIFTGFDCCYTEFGSTNNMNFWLHAAFESVKMIIASQCISVHPFKNLPRLLVLKPFFYGLVGKMKELCTVGKHSTYHRYLMHG